VAAQGRRIGREHKQLPSSRRLIVDRRFGMQALFAQRRRRVRGIVRLLISSSQSQGFGYGLSHVLAAVHWDV
jgi:hypothetical protein